MNEYVATIRLWWAERNKREQLIAVAAVSVFVLMLLFLITVQPLLSGHSKWGEATERRGDRLFELVTLERKHMASAGKKNTSGKRLGQTSPIQFLEGLASRVGVKDRIRNIRPGQSERENNVNFTTVTFQIDELTMREMTDLLYQLEIGSGYDLAVTRFKAERKEFKEKTRLNINATVRIKL